MIVKNEAHVIERCLTSVRPLISAWAIVDTGSTDGTQTMVRELLADLPGELIECPWQDFATNRNQALELARHYGEYALIHDADEIIELDPQAARPDRLEADGYYIRQQLAGHELEYSAARILRLDRAWRWHGVVHEYPALEPQPQLPLLPGIRVISYPDGARSNRPQRDKYLDDAEILRTALRKDPGNARHAFYLAQSLRDAGETAQALEAYRKRAAMPGWAEETWYALFQVACLLERLEAPDNEIIDAYLNAFDTRPTRAEPLCELARMLRLRGRHASAWVHARHAAELPQPDDLLFLDLSVYRWRARDEQAVSAWYVGRHQECVQLCHELLADTQLPESERPRVRANAEMTRTAGIECDQDEAASLQSGLDGHA